MEGPDGGDIPCVCLGATRWHADGVNGLGIRTDRSKGQTDGSRGQVDMSKGQVDASTTSTRPETAVVSHSEGAGTYLGAGDAKRDGDETDGIGSHTDLPTGHGDVPSIANDMNISANIRRNIRMHQMDSRMRNSPYAIEIVMPDPASQWRRVGVGDINVYVLWNAPVEAPGRTFAFGQLESGVEAIVPDVEGEMAEGAGDGGGGRDEDDGDGDDMESGSSADSQ